jgi:hypothetical protein
MALNFNGYSFLKEVQRALLLPPFSTIMPKHKNSSNTHLLLLSGNFVKPPISYLDARRGVKRKATRGLPMG